MSTNETELKNATTTDFVGFQNVEVTGEAEGPSLPDSVAHGVVINAQNLATVLKSINANEKVSAEFTNALEGRPAGFLVVSLYPVPRGNEVETRKARKVYGAGKGIALPFADPDNNRLQLTSIMFAPIEKKVEGDSGAAGKAAGADADLDEETK